MSWELRQRLERVARRIRSLRLWTTLTLCWLAWAGIGAAMIPLASIFGGRGVSMVPLLAAMATFTAVVCGYAALRSARDQRAVARRIESRHPELHSLLLTAVEQAPPRPGHGLGFLQHAVVHDAVQHGRMHDWTRIVAGWQIGLAQATHIAAFVLLVAVCVSLGRHGALASSATSNPPGRNAAGKEFDVEIEPGNTELERGTSLVVVATFPGDVPADATLVVSDAPNESAPNTVAHDASEYAARDRSVEDNQRVAVQVFDMTRPLDDPKFVGRIASVDNDLTYYVESAGWQSKRYRVTVFDYPELVRADAKLEFPGYSGLNPTTVEDVRQITAVEGTHLTLLCRLNKEVAEARLVANDGEDIRLSAVEDSPTLYRAAWKLGESRRLKLHLLDGDGRKNRLPADIVINVTPNRPPKIVVERPGRDTDVSPLEELALKAAITDDYGVQRGGVSYSLGGEQPRDIELLDAGAPTKQCTLDHIIDFESLAAEPDQLLSYFVWAEDFGPDGQPRRTMSDMYFAEVRHFEQIFRQREQPPGGAQQQNGNRNMQTATELAELQKEIVNATWKLIRRETNAAPTAEFPADARLLHESQQSAIDRAGELASRLEDNESGAHLKRAVEQMQSALNHLSAAADDSSIEVLNPALAAEQQAYQSLLKLRAREFQVVEGNRQQGGGSAGSASRMQRQLDQLELKSEENRYETQSQAQTKEETQSQRDARDVLNRLRELARRQDDLNERLKEVQSALEQAQTAKRQEELRRELKRLRDQQQQILRDTDDMIGRMDRSENRESMDRARDRAANSRSHLQQASEALEQGQVSQALTEGTRAERQLSDLRDEFRQQAANRFSEEMTEIRRNARRLDDDQQRLAEQLTEGGREPGRGLRDTGHRAEVGQGLGQQRRQLDDLMQRMQQTVEEAEQPEPLLARQLYDAVRQAHQHKIGDALNVSQRLIEVGIEPEAAQAMRSASQGIGQLRRGVERAAESVLGDETEALRRAEQEIEQLVDELKREIEEAQAPHESATSETAQLSLGNNDIEDVLTESRGTSPRQSRQQGREGIRRRAADGGSLRGSPEEARGAEFDGGLQELLGAGGPGGPVTGETFWEWSGRMRDVEEMLDDAELRGEAARIRDRAQEARGEYKRHAKMPDWSKLDQMVAEPLNELGRRIAEEIRRRESPDALVPIDRDPVPPEFVEQVRRYYERLGSGE